MYKLMMTSVAAGTLMLGGCAYHGGSAHYRGYEAQGEQAVRFGVVETVRDVRVHAPNTGVGSSAGALVGSVAGSHAGGGHHGSLVGFIGGAIIGSIVGHNVEQAANELRGLEVTVLLDSGQYIAIVQGADEAFRAGDRVRVLAGRNSTRVTH